jgi:hypothetical protein
MDNKEMQGFPLYDKEENNSGYPLYDNDDSDDTTPIASSMDCTGLQPTPPKNEGEAESYAQMYNIPQQTDKVDNGLQNIKKTKNNEDVERSK